MSDNSSGKNIVANQDNGGMSQGMLNFFTDEQYNQIMKMISKDKSKEHVANMAGNVNSQSLEDLADYWIVDTGATDHMASNSDMLKTMTGLPDSSKGSVNLPKGKTVRIICKGSYKLTDHDVIHDDLYTGKVKGIGKEKGGLYLLIPKGSNRNKMAQRINSCLVEGMQTDITTWHRRLGHVDKFSPRVITAVHMGYSVSQKGYKLYDLRRRKFFVSRDVTFKEDIFPFQLGKDDTQQYPMFLELKSKGEDYSLHQQQPYMSGEGYDTVNQAIEHGHEVMQQEYNLIGTNTGHGEQPPDTKIAHNMQIPSNEATEEVQAVQLQISNRGSKPPIWMQDYVCPINGASSSNCTYPISNYVNYNAMSATYQTYLTATSQETEPTSYTKAMKDPRWVEVMKTEVDALVLNNT
ncbi:uncharacterized protein [Nicotiana sylvestris]|uniref:Uncharacterized protein LOC104236058 n=1 Tax=Nicotiana sylvestris TaxID=4096 RepID=A0A1U7XEW8_NICSY|nr:PREDICTED: uncharacterized protein LOC104236058 [Nicotiana sylvestris]